MLVRRDLDSLLTHNQHSCFSPIRASRKRPRSLIPRRFPGVYRLFAGLAPVIAAEFAVLLDDSVAGDHQGDGVGAHRQPHGASCLVIADGARHLGVAHYLGGRDLQQRPPNADLKVGAAHVQGDRTILCLAGIEHGVDDPPGA